MTNTATSYFSFYLFNDLDLRPEIKSHKIKNPVAIVHCMKTLIEIFTILKFTCTVFTVSKPNQSTEYRIDFHVYSSIYCGTV